MQERPVDLPALRKPFPPEQIGKLPRGRTELDYVGHADVTSRLLEVDPEWNWEPLAADQHGLPLFDLDNNSNPVGLWIKLTIGGVTRLGYGSVPSNQNDAVKVLIGDCLLTGTPVRTRDGWQPIESVTVGQEVPTRRGWHRVADHWLSAENAPVMAVLTDDGRVLVATPHHRIPTQRGMVSVRALRNGDMLYAWADTAKLPMQKTSTGTVASTGGSPTIPTGIAGSTSWPRRHRALTFTETSTKPSTVPSPPGGMSTTATMTRSTMSQATSSLSHPQSTPGTTTRNAYRPFTVANVAALTSLHGNTPGTSAGAAHAANRLHVTQRDWFPQGPARQNRPSSTHALNAGTASNQRNHGLSTAVPRVVAVLDAGVGEVWNLSVTHVHEYVANGLIVSNSLRNAAMRFGVALDLWAKGDRADPAAENATASAGQARRNAAPNTKTSGNAKTEDLIQKAVDAKTPDELNAAWKAAGHAGKLDDEITVPATGEKTTFRKYLFQRHDEVSVKKSRSEPEAAPGGKLAGQ